MGNPQQPVEDLHNAFQVLRQRWKEVCATWNDEVRWHFERTYWETLERDMRATQTASGQLAETLAKAMRHAP